MMNHTLAFVLKKSGSGERGRDKSKCNVCTIGYQHFVMSLPSRGDPCSDVLEYQSELTVQ